jgi:hypothetical protein
MQLLTRLALIVVMFVNSYCYSMKQPDVERSLGFIENSIIGAAAGACEVTINQAVNSVKNELPASTKAGKNIAEAAQHRTLSKRVFRFEPYHGYEVNLISMVPATAIQVAVHGIISNHLARKGELSDKEKTGAAFLAGCSSAIASSPADMLALHQDQFTHDTALNTLKAALGTDKISLKALSKLYRGLIPTALRDGGFTIEYLALCNILKKRLHVQTGSNLADALITGLPAGLLAGVITHPCDRVSTLLKKDLSKKTYKNSFQTLVQIIKEEGFKGLFKDFTPRAARILLAIPILNYAQQLLEDKMK